MTGAAGFMASHLVDELMSRGFDVVGIDDLSGGTMRNLELAQRKTKSEFKFIHGDLRDPRVVEAGMKGVDYVFHLAAYAAEGQSVFTPAQINDINIRPMNNLLVSAINNNVKKFIFTSSMAVYGKAIPPFNETFPREPVDPYGVGKAYCEQMLETMFDLHRLEYVIIRPHNVFGERQNTADPFRNVIGIWMNMMLRNKRPIIYGDGMQTRAFSYVRNVTPSLANAIDIKTNEIINLGGSDEITVKQMFNTVKAAMGSILEPQFMPDRLGEVKHAYCTTKKSRELLGYRDNYSLDSGIMRMANWVKELGPQVPSYRLPLEILKNSNSVWRDKLI